MNDNDFYAECAALLGVGHDGTPFPHNYRTRWNNRTAGRGRFPGRGIIRIFGDDVHVGLTNPPLLMVGTKDAVLETLRSL